MKKMLNEGNQIHNFIPSSGSGTVINYGSGSDFLTSYGSDSTCQKATASTVPVPVPQDWPVEPLGHDPVAVHELDALVHDDRYVLVSHLLI
jgi:hypothetical protein